MNVCFIEKLKWDSMQFDDSSGEESTYCDEKAKVHDQIASRLKKSRADTDYQKTESVGKVLKIQCVDFNAEQEDDD